MTVAQYWRLAGITYLRYTNMCAAHVRKALKESAKTEAIKSRDDGAFDAISWTHGKELARGLFIIYGKSFVLF